MSRELYLAVTLDYLNQHDKERLKEIWEASEQLIQTTEKDNIPYLRIKQDD